MTLKAILTLLLLSIIPVYAHESESLESPRKFVQEFYDWYLPIALSPEKLSGPASDIALKKKRYVFSKKLFNALKEDSVAQSNAHGEIVGIDWDPFINSMDHADRYVLGNIKQINKSFLVEVIGIWDMDKIKGVGVLAEVKQENGRWVFVDFHAPNGSTSLDGRSLLATLLRDQQSRKSASDN